MPTMTKTRTCNKSKNNSCKSSKTNSKPGMHSSTTPIHVPMEDATYDIEVIRTALGSVLGPMGYNFRVRPQSNSELGDYASISVSKKSN